MGYVWYEYVIEAWGVVGHHVCLVLCVVFTA